MWDIHLPIPRDGKPGLWIEMKVGGNDLSPEQSEFQSFLHAQGHETHVCRAWYEAAAIVLTYLGHNPDEFDLETPEEDQ